VILGWIFRETEKNQDLGWTFRETEKIKKKESGKTLFNYAIKERALRLRA